MELNETLISKYFSKLSDHQIEQFKKLGALYLEWNQKINVISRKDIDKLYLHHVLHSLSIAKSLRFKPGTKVLDLGTGGGFPGIPLAIYFPKTHFHLIDGTSKKLKVVEAVAEGLGLENVKVEQLRAEECKGKYDFVLNRAVARIDKLWQWSRPLIKRKGINGTPNGMYSLKGGNLEAELNELPNVYYEIEAISDYFQEEYFISKYLIYVQR